MHVQAPSLILLLTVALDSSRVGQAVYLFEVLTSERHVATLGVSFPGGGPRLRWLEDSTYLFLRCDSLVAEGSVFQ